MILRNDLLEYSEEEGKVVRILWLHPTQPVAVTFDINTPGAKPEIVQTQVLLNDIEAGKAKLLAADTYLVVVNEESLAEKSREI